VSTAPNGDILQADGNGNVSDSGTLLSSLVLKSGTTFTGTVNGITYAMVGADAAGAAATAQSNAEAFTTAQLSSYALKSGTTFTGAVTIPTAAITTLSGNPNFSGAPTLTTSPATSDNTTKIATTAFVQSLIGGGGGSSFTSNGYTTINGLIVNWLSGTAVASNVGGLEQQTLIFPKAFPTACLWAIVSTQIAVAVNTYDCLWQSVGSPSKTQITVMLARVNTTLPSTDTTPFVLAIGY